MISSSNESLEGRDIGDAESSTHEETALGSRYNGWPMGVKEDLLVLGRVRGVARGGSVSQRLRMLSDSREMDCDVSEWHRSGVELSVDDEASAVPAYVSGYIGLGEKG